MSASHEVKSDAIIVDHLSLRYACMCVIVAIIILVMNCYHVRMTIGCTVCGNKYVPLVMPCSTVRRMITSLHNRHVPAHSSCHTVGTRFECHFARCQQHGAICGLCYCLFGLM